MLVMTGSKGELNGIEKVHFEISDLVVGCMIG